MLRQPGEQIVAMEVVGSWNKGGPLSGRSQRSRSLSEKRKKGSPLKVKRGAFVGQKLS